MMHCVTRKTEIRDVLTLYKYIRARYPSTALLESLGEFSDDISQYSFIGVVAKEQLYEKNDTFYVKEFSDHSVRVTNDWLGELDAWCGPMGQSASPLQTGTIGYIGYEMHRYFEFVPDSEKLRSPVSKICLTRYSLLYLLDHKNSEAYWISDECMDDVISHIESGFSTYEPSEEFFCTLGDTEKDFTGEGYLDAIRKCIHHIEIGDMLQANITMRFSGRYQGSPLVLYELHL